MALSVTLAVLSTGLFLAQFLVHAQDDTLNDFDPLNDFCRRFGHQTAVIDNILYIDGGYVDYGGSVNPDTTNYTNTYLLYLDLDAIVPDINFPTQYANLSKPSNVPSVAGGSLWADTVNKYLYLYGGEYNWTTFPSSTSELWYYDALHDEWDTKQRDADILSVSFGASVVAQDQGKAYYYGGWISNATQYGTLGDPVAQSSLMSYDMVEDVWQNVTFYDSTPRAEGVMFYIPASDSGMLVYFGGVQRTSNGSYTGVPLDEIYLYDLASGKAYKQPTTGTPPARRRRFCGGVQWADDQSSYNIYFYGGLQPPDEEGYGYGDVWILSIPSFTWTNWYPSSGEHHSLSCNVIDNSQMIIMGGYFPNSSILDCDAKPEWGQHNLNLGANDADHAEWYQYLPKLTTYEVPQTIYSAIGGGPTGGATLTAPANGWATADLEVYFGRKAQVSPRTATRDVSLATNTSPSGSSTPKPTPSNVGAIAGGAVGGGVGLLIIVGVAWYCLRQHRKKKRVAAQPDHMTNNQAGPHSGPWSHSNAARQVSGTSEMAAAPYSPSKGTVSPQMTSDGFSHPSSSPPPPQWAPYTRQGEQWSQPGIPIYHSPQQQPQMHAYQQHSPPQQQQHFYPRPPSPQQYEHQPSPIPSPIHEMPNVQSPVHTSDTPTRRSGGRQYA